MSFTPGPWKYFSGSRTVYTEDEKKAIDRVFGPRHPTPEQRAEFEANGQLIASAPTMHAEIADLREYCELQREAIKRLLRMTDLSMPQPDLEDILGPEKWQRMAGLKQRLFPEEGK